MKFFTRWILIKQNASVQRIISGVRSPARISFSIGPIFTER